MATGLLQTVFSAAQLLGGPLIGRVCDSRGARLALLLSQVSVYVIINVDDSFECIDDTYALVQSLDSLCCEVEEHISDSRTSDPFKWTCA